MKISDKLFFKYATGTPILPPPSEDDVEVKIPVSKNDVSDKWLALLEEAAGFDPLTEKPAQSAEELLEIVRDIPKQEIPVENIGQDQPTVKPPKKAKFSFNTLLKMCSRYYDLCSKF